MSKRDEEGLGREALQENVDHPGQRVSKDQRGTEDHREVRDRREAEARMGFRDLQDL